MYYKTCLYEKDTLKYLANQLTNNSLITKTETHIASCIVCCETIAHLYKLTDVNETLKEKAFLETNLAKIEQATCSLIENTLKERNVKSVQNTQPPISSTKTNSFRKKTHYLVLAASLTTLLLSGKIVLLNSSCTSLSTDVPNVEESLVTLQQLTESRTIEFRLSGLSYTPIIESRGSLANNQQKKLSAILLTLEATASKYPNANNYHVLGQALVISNQYDAALTQLSQADSLDPNNLAILTDLAAAEAAKSDYTNALLIVNKALSINSNYLSGIFN
ncbi:MAG: hypothetical protein FD167_3413, partial [bacterium]